MKLSEFHTALIDRACPITKDALVQLMVRAREEKLGQGQVAVYTYADIRFVQVWWNWGVITGNRWSPDAMVAGGIARHFDHGWAVKTGGQLFQTDKPALYLDKGLVAVPLAFD